MTPDDQARAEAVTAAMMRTDAFSRWLGVEIVETGPARSTIRMTVRPEMCNGFGVCHGGVTYALADSAFAFACNSHGTVTVAIENGISYPAAVRVGEVLTATAVEASRSNRILYYSVTVTNAAGAVVALFRGTGYRTEKPHDIAS